MSEELKNQIRRERILKIMKRYTNKDYIISKKDGKYIYNSIPNISYYKSKYIFSLNGLTEDALIKFQNKIIKEDCNNCINNISKYSCIFIHYDQIRSLISNVDVDEALLITYRIFLFEQIYHYCPQLDTKELVNKSNDELEEILDRSIVEYKDKEKKSKRWWNIF